MIKWKRAVQGLMEMPAKARQYLGYGMLLSAAFLSLAILTAVASQGDEAVFTFWRLTDRLQRISSLPLYIGIICSLSAATKEKR